ncbi:hypothetical protein AMS68_002178 [Peltaster fructicola]|uniref:Mitochondrial presequence protease n=1 Tax=Peltaster fructicola TaxID=286661 RepID=A0A6H0XPT3_9PEZI|nr:hypothetical protein AMS68_002178 [Peltaster fructicola]
MPAAKEPQSHFRVVQQFTLDYAPVDLTQYESTRTGMRCVVVNQPGPKVNGYFALATEIHDSSGAPHTLEHLVFMGSRSYHYKGLLDKLATRAYSTTNAWTATDQTAYTLSTAGWDGFAQILPIYLEHLLLPTITDSACMTEVHHIDGTGHDAGVVYSEMQGVQNAASSLIHEKSKQLLYPPGNGFRYETGGEMDALRVLKADRIRDYHAEMYQPKNMCLVITGDVDEPDLLHILDEFEATILEDIPTLDAPFKRPWVDSEPTPPLKKTVVDTVEFPEEDESVGELLISWHGPSCNDAINSSAMDTLLIYLAGSSISVLENTLVEKEQIASGVYYDSEYRPNTVYSFTLTAVETDRLKEADKRLHDLLAEVASKPFDLDYMRDCISRSKRQLKIRCEEAGDFFSDAIITDHLYGNRDGQHLRQLKTISELDDLESWTDAQWRAFLDKWLINNPHVSVLGIPSAQLSKKLKQDEKDRLQERQSRLGEKGLRDLADKLEKAKADNDAPIPDQLLEKFPVPGTESVHFISSSSAQSGPSRDKSISNPIQDIIDKDSHNSSLFIHWEHIPSNFVRIKIVLGTHTVPTELKPLISLYLMNLFTSPVTIDGQRVEFEEVVTRLERDTIGYAITTEPGNSEMLSLAIDLEPESYEKVIEWIRIVLFDAIHDKARLHASLTKILADIPDEKRSGRSMLSAVALMLQYEPESALRASSTLTKALHLKRVRKQLEKDPNTVIAKFTELCKAINRPENMRIKVAANIETLKKPVSSWTRLATAKQPLEPLKKRKDFLSKLGQTPGSYAYVVPIAAIDSSFASLLGKGIDSYKHPDLPALLVAIAYMDAVEGPMWTAVRGTGFAYGSWFSRSTDPGTLGFNIYRSASIFKAYTVAKEQTEGYASGKFDFNKFALEGAVSSIVLAMADEQATMAQAAEASFLNQVIRGVSKDHSHTMLARVRKVTPEDIRGVMKTYMVPIFESASANLIITCSKTMTEQLLEQFSQVGFQVEERSLESLYDAYGMEADAQEDEESSEEEDEGEGSEGDATSEEEE